MITVCMRVTLAESLVYTLSVCSDRDLFFIIRQSDLVGVQIRYHVLIWLG